MTRPQPRRSFPAAALLLSLAATMAAPALGQTGYPMILAAFPMGCRRGAVTEVTVSGRMNLAGAYAAMFDAPGLTGEIVAPPTSEADKPRDNLTMRVTVAADAPMGAREFRLATPRGISSVGMLVVSDETPVVEVEPNQTPATATPVTLPAGLDGVLNPGEDVDCYRFIADAGDQIVAACVAASVQDRIHDLSPGGGGTHVDPILSLLDSQGTELALADNYWGADPLLAYRIPRSGTYILTIRDVRYLGMPVWPYRVSLTRGPYLTGVFPMAGRRGQPTPVEPVGFNTGAVKPGAVIPAMTDVATRVDVQLDGPGARTNPVPFLLSDFPQFTEGTANDTPDKATAAAVPAGFNGRLEVENDVDCFRFQATKGVAYTFEVRARRYGSALDSTIRLRDPKGNTFATNDDVLGKDSRLDWSCPTDGEYVLEITDLNSRGGPDFLYNVEVRVAEPDFELFCDDDKALIGPGSGYAMYVYCTPRNGFRSEIKLAVEDLPPGVTAVADRLPPSMLSQPLAACVTLRGAAEAKPGYRRIRIWGDADVQRPDGTLRHLRRLVTPMQEIYTPGGGRGRFEVTTHVASVTEPGDITVKLARNEVVVKPGSTAELDVEVTRKAGFTGGVSLDVILRHLGTRYGDPLPPGVTLEDGGKTLLSPTETRGKLIFRAAAGAAPIEKLPIAVLGQVSINFVVKVSHASEPFMLSVRP